MENLKRCSWCLKDELYINYHDNIWGKPEYSNKKLFEYINLEGAQAGLSWYTILCRIDNYRDAFHNWDIEKILKMSDKDLEARRSNPGIIRNKLKIHAVYNNAIAYQKMKEQNIDFSDFLWSYVGGKPIDNNFKSMSQVPAKTEISVKLSKDLKKLGFKFVGPTIVYAFMQAVGMVNDHMADCWVRRK